VHFQRLSAKRGDFHAFSMNHCKTVYFQNVEDALKIFKNPWQPPIIFYHIMPKSTECDSVLNAFSQTA
jgi:hypothetical protein